MSAAPRPRLALAVLFSVTIVWLLLTLLRWQPGSFAAENYPPPRLHDAPFRGAPLAPH